MEIRRALPADFPALAGLRWRWHEENGDPSTFDRESFLEWFGDWAAAHPAYLPFLAVTDGQACGMAWLLLFDRVPSPHLPGRPTGDVQSVYVEPALRNAGVGAALIAAVLTEARARGLHHVTVHSAGRAVPFYERCGFVRYQRWLEWKPSSEPLP